jgi:hypothetical protein
MQSPSRWSGAAAVCHTLCNAAYLRSGSSCVLWPDSVISKRSIARFRSGIAPSFTGGYFSNPHVHARNIRTVSMGLTTVASTPLHLRFIPSSGHRTPAANDMRACAPKSALRIFAGTCLRVFASHTKILH